MHLSTPQNPNPPFSSGGHPHRALEPTFRELERLEGVKVHNASNETGE